jgi:hypothetical protein
MGNYRRKFFRVDETGLPNKNFPEKKILLKEEKM